LFPSRRGDSEAYEDMNAGAGQDRLFASGGGALVADLLMGPLMPHNDL